jgi:hypothetical protein
MSNAVQRGQFRILTRGFAFHNNQRLLGYRPPSALRTCARRPSRPKGAGDLVLRAEDGSTEVTSVETSGLMGHD